MANQAARLSADALEKMDNTLIVRVSDSPEGRGKKKALVGWGTMANTQHYDEYTAQTLGEILRLLADAVEVQGRAGTLESVYIVYQKEGTT